MAIGSNPGGATQTVIGIERERFAWAADAIAVALAIALPWSTTATGILVVVWIAVFIPNANKESLQRALLSPAGGLPVLLWMLAVVGMLWADVSLAERLEGLGPFHKLLVIPLLMIHFSRSERGHWVIVGFLLSCGVLLVVSWIWFFFPTLPRPAGKAVGIVVKDYISQSAMFVVCIAVLCDLAVAAWRKARLEIAVAYVLLALGFLANIFFIATSRTALVVLPILFLLFALKRLDWKTAIGLLAVLAILTAGAWSTSSYMQLRVAPIIHEVQSYLSENARTSAGERLEYWKKSIRFIADAPVIGHGTGTIRALFLRSTIGQTGLSALPTTNPHNQTFAVAIQLGFAGVIVLYAMWIAHLLLFRGEGFVTWIGLVVVVQNVVGSLFNSHLSDFTHGWGYVIGVGVAGGMAIKSALRDPQRHA